VQFKKDTNGVTAERVTHIEQLMASGLYRPGITPGQLAEKWGLSRQTVANLACEASRGIRREIGRSEDLRTRMIATLATITAESIAKKRYRDAIEAIKVMSGVVDSDEKSSWEMEARKLERDLLLGQAGGGVGKTSGEGSQRSGREVIVAGADGTPLDPPEHSADEGVQGPPPGE